jgi:hypothetical protein
MSKQTKLNLKMKKHKMNAFLNLFILFLIEIIFEKQQNMKSKDKMKINSFTLVFYFCFFLKNWD